MNAILGACVGDAAGATLEFNRGNITFEMALNAMKMPGGGVFCVGPGQITDDGELTLALWSAIKSEPCDMPFPIVPVIKAYADWYKSIPFDIGRTCSLAFDSCHDLFTKLSLSDITDEDIYLLKRTIYSVNKGSEANGALMRATAIATWFAKSDLEAYIGAQAAMEDAVLSHPSQVCQEVNAIYVFTLINLLRGMKPDEALKYTQEFVKMNTFSEKVVQWFEVESLDITKVNSKENMGHVRWGFVMAFYFLRNPEITYEDAIQQVLMKGGDTDTNAAIVGGLVATYQSIPEFMSRPVLEFDCTKQNIKRPSEYSVKQTISHLL